MPVNAAEQILDEELKGYRSLLELLQRERVCLVGLDAAGYEELVKEKDVLILRLRLLEEERMRIIRRDYGADVSLQRLGELTGNPRFQTMRSMFISLVQGIEELNSINRILIGRSLDYVRGTARFFTFSGVGSAAGAGKGVLYAGEV